MNCSFSVKSITSSLCLISNKFCLTLKGIFIDLSNTVVSSKSTDNASFLEGNISSSSNSLCNPANISLMKSL